MNRAIDASFGTVIRHTPILLGLAALLLFVFACGQRFGVFGEELRLATDSLAGEGAGAEGREVEIFTVLPRDAIRSIDAPKFLTALAATDQMSPVETVLGIEVDGEARAYPISMLSRHEIVNDVIGGIPIAVTYCPLCFTGIVYERRVDGEVLEFGVSGKLVMNDLVMYDRESDSLWQQILGEGIRGRYKGVRLEPLPATHTSWQAWVAQYPETVVLDKEGNYVNDNYTGYYRRNDIGVIGGTSRGDPRLSGKDLVLGVIAGDQPKAYGFEQLETSPVVNDVVGGLALLIVFDRPSSTTIAFDRKVDGRTLTFEAGIAGDGTPALVDAETGTTWSQFTGEAIAGPLGGSRLSQLPATYAFWFAWSDFYTQTQLYGEAP